MIACIKFRIQNNTYLTTSHIDELSPPGNISLRDASPSKLAFEWNSVTHDCPYKNHNLNTAVVARSGIRQW